MAIDSPARNHRTYSFRQLEQAWVRNGGKPGKAAVAAAVALAESSGLLGAVGDGGSSFGPWQVHTPAHPQYNARLLTSSLDYSAKAAIEISGNGSSWAPWSTFNSGAYKSHLPNGSNDNGPDGLFGIDALSGFPDQSILGGGSINPLDAAKDAVDGLLKFPGQFLDLASAMLSFFKLITSVDFWIRAGEVIGGVMLLHAGLKGLTGQGIPGVDGAKKAAKTGAEAGVALAVMPK